MMNVALQKHLQMCKRDTKGSTQLKECVGMAKRLVRMGNRFWETARPHRFPLAALSLIGLFSCILVDRFPYCWSFRPAERNNAIILLLLAVLLACCVSCLRRFHQKRQTIRDRIKLEEALRLRLQTKLVVSESLGTVVAPSLHVDDISTASIMDFSSSDATTLERLVEVQVESLKALDDAIHSIDTSTRFFFGRMSSRSTLRVLPALRRQVDTILMGKLRLLRRLCATSIVVVTDNDLSDTLLETTWFERDVITLSRLRDMTTAAKRLLSELCRLVLCGGSTACLRQQTFIVDQAIQEAQCSTAYLMGVTNAATLWASDSGREHWSQTAFLLGEMSDLRIALLSLHQQHSVVRGDSPTICNDMLRQQWATVSRRLHCLTNEVDGILAEGDKATPGDGQNPTQFPEPVSLSFENLMESKDPDIAVPVPPVSAVETLVYADVSEAPKPRQQRHRQDFHCNASRIQHAPFDLVEELHTHIRMMALPEEREAMVMM